jgi:hypothetical protein
MRKPAAGRAGGSFFAAQVIDRRAVLLIARLLLIAAYPREDVPASPESCAAVSDGRFPVKKKLMAS